MLCTLRRGDSIEVDQASSLPDESLRHDSSPRARLARKQSLGLKALRVLTPTPGWCSASQCCVGRARDVGHAWRYVVVCRDGAYVRRGLELASTHAFTLPKDAVFEVRERRVNEQGLARLRTDDGWISEDLNPLSGQRGPVAEPLPVAAPLTFRVVLRDGAVVRQGRPALRPHCGAGRGRHFHARLQPPGRDDPLVLPRRRDLPRLHGHRRGLDRDRQEQRPG